MPGQSDISSPSDLESFYVVVQTCQTLELPCSFTSRMSRFNFFVSSLIVALAFKDRHFPFLTC